MRYIITLLLVLCCNSAFAGSGISGAVTQLINHETGDVLITFEGGMPSNDGCKNASTAVLKSDVARFKEIYAMALAAASQGKVLGGWTAGPCAAIYGETYPFLIRLDWVK